MLLLERSNVCRNSIPVRKFDGRPMRRLFLSNRKCTVADEQVTHNESVMRNKIHANHSDGEPNDLHAGYNKGILCHFAANLENGNANDKLGNQSRTKLGSVSIIPEPKVL